MFSQSPPDNICIVRLSAIGDTCHALAVVRSIQDAWPETRITWIIGKTEATLLSDIQGIEFIIFDKSDSKNAKRKIRKMLATREFDVALCLHASMRSNFITRSIHSPLRLGYDFSRARDFQWLFTNRRIPPKPAQHVLDGMLEFSKAIGVPKQKLRWDIPLSAAHREFAAEHSHDTRPLMVISPCSSQRARNFRNWGAENYAAAVNFARNRFQCDIVLTGGDSPVEREYGRTIEKLCGSSVKNLMGQTSLKQLLAIIESADLLLCPDSGPAHMATTVDTPVVGLYASSNPDRTGPYLSQQLVVSAYPEACRKYLGKAVEKLRWGQRVRETGAMGMIRLGEVNQKIQQVLS